VLYTRVYHSSPDYAMTYTSHLLYSIPFATYHELASMVAVVSHMHILD